MNTTTVFATLVTEPGEIPLARRMIHSLRTFGGAMSAPEARSQRPKAQGASWGTPILQISSIIM